MHGYTHPKIINASANIFASCEVSISAISALPSHGYQYITCFLAKSFLASLLSPSDVARALRQNKSAESV